MHKLLKNSWPCIGSKGFEIFATTADQRFLLGEDLFLSTHTPVTLRHFDSTGEGRSVQEVEILQFLVKPVPKNTGNRVIILYGAAGAGKSELIRWLQLMLQNEDRQRANKIIRIPRTELDVLSIIERFQHLLSDQWFSESTHGRWKEAHRKPRAIAKLILLSALTNMLNSDELINALYFRLLDWIEPRITKVLCTPLEADDKSAIPLEVVTREDLEQLRSESIINMPLDYEKFRYQMLLAFREHLLESVHLPTTLRLISDDLFKQGIRPVLLIDDLVQSINLFATEILDYLITLESGNWDVVIGLTPDAFTDNDRGRQLLDRITYLDTIDDRVEKLWLSDIKGHESYNLNTENCIDFVHRYLVAYRKENGWECSSCHRKNQCQNLEMMGKQENDRILVPFNTTSLKRIFSQLPDGKGKPRQYLNRVRTILEELYDGKDLIGIIGRRAKLDFASEANQELVARLVELYFPSVEDGLHNIPGNFFASFGLPDEHQEVVIRNISTANINSYKSVYIATSPDDLYVDPSKKEIKEWLDGEPVNRHMLQQLRRGIARWIRTIYPIDGLHKEYIARPNNILRCDRVYLDVRPPICFEDVDPEQGVLITREVGLTAFLFSDYAIAAGPAARRIVYNLTQDERALGLLFSVVSYQQKLKNDLEYQLGMPTEELAVYLYILSKFLRSTDGINIQECRTLASLFSKSRDLSFMLKRHEVRLLKAGEAFFDDFFKLRDNIYDGYSLNKWMTKHSLDDIWNSLLSINPSGIDADFSLDGHPLKEQLCKVQMLAQKAIKIDRDHEKTSQIVSLILETLMNADDGIVYLNAVPTSIWEEIHRINPELYAALKVSIEM